MSSTWIYIDADGRVHARSWPKDALSEASAQISQRLLAARPSAVVTLRFDHDKPHLGAMQVEYSVGVSGDYAGKLLLVPDWVANALTWPRSQAYRGFLSVEEFRAQYQGDWPAHDAAEAPHAPDCAWPYGDGARCACKPHPALPASHGAPCERCGLVLGCACDRGA